MVFLISNNFELSESGPYTDMEHNCPFLPIDGLYQINSKNMGESVNIDELNLTVGVLFNIVEEMEQLFDCEKSSDFSFHYISTLEEKHKKLSSVYSSDMRRCDIRIPVKPEITPWLKHQNIMEIVEEAWKLFNLFIIEK